MMNPQVRSSDLLAHDPVTVAGLPITGKILKSMQAINRPHPVRIGIDGIDAAGKTTLADALGAILKSQGRQVIRASLDGFHNPRHIRYAQGKDSPEGYYEASFDYESLIHGLLQPLGPGGKRRYRTSVFNHADDLPDESSWQFAAPQSILIFDGIFLQRPILRDFWELCIFIEISFEAALRRALRRDLGLWGEPRDIRRRYEQRYFPAQRRYLEECQPAARADLVVEAEELWVP